MKTTRLPILCRTARCFVIALMVALCWAALPVIESHSAEPTPVQKVDVQDAAKKVKVKKQLALAEDNYGRATPRGCVEGFLEATRQRDYQRATKYLDLRRLPPSRQAQQGPILARELRIVLDRALPIDFDLLSTDPQGHSDDGLPSYRDWIGRIESQLKPVNIVLQRVPRDDGKLIWQFSSATVAQIPHLYDEYGYGRVGEILPEVVVDLNLLGIPMWWWVAIVVFGFLAYLIAVILRKVALLVLRRIKPHFFESVQAVISGPLFFLTFVLLWRAAVRLLGPSVAVEQLMRGGLLAIVAIAWTIICLSDLFLLHLRERLDTSRQSATMVLLQPLRNLVRIVVVLIAAIVWLGNIDYNVTGILTGLGVGGIAVALAAQKSIENLIGAVTLLFSQPVRVGEFCRFGNSVGTVEEIGLRSTRVRTLDRTLMSIPNAEFANLHIDNFSKREKIWYHPRLRLRYETTPDQIRYILVEVRKLLYSHPKVLTDPARIRFVEFGPYSLDLEIFAYVDVTDFGEYLEIAEDLNLRIMEVVKEAGSSFAVPTQITYLERGKGLDEGLTRDAEAKVHEWREQNELYLPDFPPEKIAEIKGSLEYPPPGSPKTKSGA